MIHEIVAVMAERATAANAGAAIHAYPTLSESVKGALTSLTQERTYP
jgi:pyruvate/2-oxoglutarate dehydrogenase complex dihydrolipoamide dehydrogenase (E3) component